MGDTGPHAYVHAVREVHPPPMAGGNVHENCRGAVLSRAVVRGLAIRTIQRCLMFRDQLKVDVPAPTQKVELPIGKGCECELVPPTRGYWRRVRLCVQFC